MIYSVRGELVHTEQALAVVECGGVGYGCRTTANTLRKLKVGEEVKLFTYTHYIKDGGMEFFGFADTLELSSFKQLISVTGVGPKAALSILSDLTPSKLALCITTGDSKTLTRCVGIGSKIAQRIVLELKDKVAKEQRISAADYAAAPTVVAGGSNVGEALEALCVLGFPMPSAQAALAGADPNGSVEDLIKHALKNLG